MLLVLGLQASCWAAQPCCTVVSSWQLTEAVCHIAACMMACSCQVVFVSTARHARWLHVQPVMPLPHGLQVEDVHIKVQRAQEQLPVYEKKSEAAQGAVHQLRGDVDAGKQHINEAVGKLRNVGWVQAYAWNVAASWKHSPKGSGSGLVSRAGAQTIKLQTQHHVAHLHMQAAGFCSALLLACKVNLYVSDLLLPLVFPGTLQCWDSTSAHAGSRHLLCTSAGMQSQFVCI